MPRRKNKTKPVVKEHKRKQLTGLVTSKKMDKTLVVKVETSFAHQRYSKILTKIKKYKVHSEKELNVGDKVVIEQTRPISKEKCWRVIEVVKD
jgi:small subunit ribosomal protein S17